MSGKAGKATSVLLMAIMVAGGLTFAIPGVQPVMAQSTNPNLSVSAESTVFDNYFSGPQVVEVVIIDPDIDETNEQKGEPDVTINGSKLRMVQATDGKWYAYVADVDFAIAADRAVTSETHINKERAAVEVTGAAIDVEWAGKSLDFGTICTPDQAEDVFNEAIGERNAGFFSDAIAVAFPFYKASYDFSATPVASPEATSCAVTADITQAFADRPTSGTGNAGMAALNVVREEKSINDGQNFGQSIADGGADVNAGDTEGLWPFVQLYDFNPTGTVNVQYNRGGGTQSVALNFDTVDHLSSLSLDRTTYPNNAEVHFTIADTWLDVDPTDEDSWSWDVIDTDMNDPDGDGPNTATAVYYQAFDENGLRQADATEGDLDLSAAMADLGCDGDCLLKLNVDAQRTNSPVVELADNGNSNPGLAGDITEADDSPPSELLTVTETEATSGVFTSYDESDKSALRTTDAPNRDTTATIDYNETPQSISIGYAFASIDIQPTGDAWMSGQEVPVVLTDADANRNSLADEDLDVLEPDHIIPTLVTGSPVTLTSGATLALSPDGGTIAPPTGAAPSYATSSIEADGTSPEYGAITLDNTPNNAASVTTADRDADPSLRVAASFGSSEETDKDNQRFLVIDYGLDAAPLPSVTDAVMVPALGSGPATAETWVRAVPTVTAVLSYDFGGLEFADGVSAGGQRVDIYALAGTGATILSGAGGSSLAGVTAYRIAENVQTSGVVEITGDVTRDITVRPTTTTSGAKAALAGAVVGPLTDAEGNAFVGPIHNSFGLMAHFDNDVKLPTDRTIVIADIMSFGFTGDGVNADQRVANQVVRLELEETADDTGIFEGTLEYAMVNQLNIADPSTYDGLALIDDEGTLVAIEDLTDEDTLTVTYNDLGRDGVVTPVSDDEAAPSHSGTVSLDATSYKIADTVTVTVRDADLNTSSDTTEVYTIPRGQDYVGRADGQDVLDTDTAASIDMIGFYQLERSFGQLGRLADITFDDSPWARGTPQCDPGQAHGLGNTGFTLRETSAASGVFEGDFQIPTEWCAPGKADTESVTGLDIEVNYVDYRDASGEIIEVGDGAGLRANTGSVSLDRPVYPVPFGNDREGSHFKTYEETGDPAVRTLLAPHAVTIHVRVTDPDFDVSASGSDTLGQRVDRTTDEGNAYGPLRVSVQRGSDNVVLGYAGGPTAEGATGDRTSPADGDRLVRPLSEVFSPHLESDGTDADHEVGAVTYTMANAIEHGPLTETAPSSGTFELDLPISWDQGPPSTDCPGGQETSMCILQGDILVVEYTDPADASGNPQTVTDSATFDMRNAVLRSDKSVYIIGSDMILTLIEPDLDLDNDTAETYPLELVEWDDDDSVTGLDHAAFDPEPTSLRETGDSTGIFQVVVEIPAEIGTDDLERGEEIELTYQDWSPAGADFVGETDEEIEWSIFTSDFGATIELDQAVYTWTDKVFITVVAPDHNFDSNLIDEIGDTTEDPLQVSTREGGTLDNYRLTETGTDTGIFSGEVILTGFEHDADGDGSTGTNGNDRLNLAARGNGPTDGTIAADDDDGITVSYEYNDDEHVIGSALIRWNVGDTQWLEASYPASGSGVVRVVDPDMNWNPEAVDNFEVDVYSDADAGGINLTVTETQEASGIFEGTVIFTLTDQSSGHRLRVAEGDTVTARYDDNTLPDPYTRNDELEVEGTTIIGTLVPPLERAVVSNVRLTDNSGNPLDTVAIGQQVQVTGQVTSGQETEQAYAYLVQVNDSSDVTLSLTWTSGTLNAGQSLTPSMSWQPTAAGEYTATVFVWESIDNPTALSPQAELPFTVG